MSSLDLSKAITCQTVSPEEAARLEAPFPKGCPSCGGPMTVGEQEAADCCVGCYFAEQEGVNNG